MMATRVGFFMFVGIMLGAILGQWLPFMPALEAIAGGVIGGVLAYALDKMKSSRK